MSDFGPGNPRETLSSFAKLGATSEPSVAGSSVGAGAAPPPPPTFSPNGSAPVPTAKQARRPRYGDCSRTEDLDGSRPPR